jgi:methionyl-tRNA synthetase
LQWYIDHFEPDALRYAIAASFPETNDTDLSDDEMVRRVNDELVSTWGNLVNRVVSMTHRYFEGVVPEAVDLTSADTALLDGIDATLAEVGEQIAAVKLRAGLSTAMAAASGVNVYLSEQEPWKSAKTDLARTGTTLAVALNAISGLAVALAPYLPFTSRTVLETLQFEVPQAGPRWVRESVPAGTVLGPAVPLFRKAELPNDED